MTDAIGTELNRQVSYPIAASDIRKWAIAVYYPEPPPRLFWDEGFATATSHGGLVAPEDFNPFAWMTAEPGGVQGPGNNDPQSTEKALGVEPPPVAFQLNGGITVTYGERMRPGDVITSVDGQPVTLAEQLGPIVRTRPPGQPVMFTVDRGGKSIPVTVVSRAAAQGACQGRAQVGISTSTRSEKFDFPVNVAIDTGRVSGPSAGLAFTLTILDELTPGDLTGGKKVAVTGTIQADGGVGPIGGAQQKAVTARRAGAKLFLVPTEEVKEARSRAGGMKVAGIRTLDDALRELKNFGGQDTGVPPATPSTACP